MKISAELKKRIKILKYLDLIRNQFKSKKIFKSEYLNFEIFLN